ncbi:MAG: DUF4870 domain-containing protein [Terriglobales bacterium]
MKTTLPEPTQDERTMAMLAHLLQLFTGFLGPLVIYFIRRESRFVAFHSLQAVFWQLCLALFFFVGIVLMIFTVVAGATQGSSKDGSPLVIGFFVLFWLGTFAVSILNLVVVIYFTVKASKGEWAENPLVGRWARQVAGV